LFPPGLDRGPPAGGVARSLRVATAGADAAVPNGRAARGELRRLHGFLRRRPQRAAGLRLPAARRIPAAERPCARARPAERLRAGAGGRGERRNVAEPPLGGGGTARRGAAGCHGRLAVPLLAPADDPRPELARHGDHGRAGTAVAVLLYAAPRIGGAGSQG